MNDVRVVSLARDTPTGPLLFIPIKYYQIISNSMGVMACTRYGFRGDNYMMKIVRVVSLARDTPTGSPLYSYQILSKYV